MRTCRHLVHLAAAALLMALPAAAPAQTKSVAEILQALQGANAGPKVRSLSREASRGISIEGPLPQDLDLPQVDLTVNFEFNSARLTTDAMLTLRALGIAMQHETLQSASFQIAGHTDAVGEDAYNIELSERRAATVAAFLANHFGVDAIRLNAVGYGETQLLYPQMPNNELNRRVTIINVDPLMN